MKSVKCSDMGMDCGYVAEAETAEQVKAMLMEHAGTVHADMMASMSEADKAKMMATIDALLV